jgi:hypothetical protein
MGLQESSKRQAMREASALSDTGNLFDFGRF